MHQWHHTTRLERCLQPGCCYPLRLGGRIGLLALHCVVLLPVLHLFSFLLLKVTSCTVVTVTDKSVAWMTVHRNVHCSEHDWSTTGLTPLDFAVAAEWCTLPTDLPAMDAAWL